ncbi:MAG: hypothetical protein PVG02_05630 [Anaerolineales bacterium]|jgi:hypothetical protein
MKRYNTWLWFSGWIGLAANVLAILGTLDDRGWLPWKLGGGASVAVVFVSMAYSLCVWAVWVWIRTHRHPISGSSDAAAFLLNALGTFPLLLLWFMLIISEVLNVEAGSARGWMLSLALAWTLTPFIALSLRFVGAVLGPYFPADDQSH